MEHALVAGGPGVHARDGADVDADGPARRTSSAGKEIGPRVKRVQAANEEKTRQVGHQERGVADGEDRAATSAAEQIPAAGEPGRS